VAINIFTANKIYMSGYFRISEIEPKYYADGENAYEMKRNLGDFYRKVSLSTLITSNLLLLIKLVDCANTCL